MNKRTDHHPHPHAAIIILVWVYASTCGLIGALSWLIWKVWAR